MGCQEIGIRTAKLGGFLVLLRTRQGCTHTAGSQGANRVLRFLIFEETTKDGGSLNLSEVKSCVAFFSTSSPTPRVRNPFLVRWGMRLERVNLVARWCVGVNDPWVSFGFPYFKQRGSTKEKHPHGQNPPRTRWDGRNSMNIESHLSTDAKRILSKHTSCILNQP